MPTPGQCSKLPITDRKSPITTHETGLQHVEAYEHLANDSYPETICEVVPLSLLI